MGTLRNIRRSFGYLLGIPTSIIETHDLALDRRNQEAMLSSKNPLNRFGRKYFSQSDEDGITLEILRRMGIETGVLIEVGCGTGLENNTLVLIAKGWRGLWLGGESLMFDVDERWSTFSFMKTWITKSNIVTLLRKGLDGYGQPNVISLDLDGNDLYVLEEILRAKFEPELFIVEFNARFPPGAEFSIEYDDGHRWRDDDYFGASLGSFMELFARYDYMLVAVNGFTGVNAFFVPTSAASRFSDVPTEISEIWTGSNYRLEQRFLHPTSPKTVKRMILLNEERWRGTPD